MMILQNRTEIFGVSEDIQIKSKYFTEFDFIVKNKIEDDIIDIILSTNAIINTGDIGIVKTPIKISSEGAYLSGYKLKVELIIDMKTKYMSNLSMYNARVKNDRIVKIIYIVVPLEYNGENTIDILRRKKIFVNTYIEDIYCEVRNYNVIYANISAIVTADFIE